MLIHWEGPVYNINYWIPVLATMHCVLNMEFKNVVMLSWIKYEGYFLPIVNILEQMSILFTPQDIKA